MGDRGQRVRWVGVCLPDQRRSPDLAGRAPAWERGADVDVEASDADTAVVLAIGEGEAPRVYRTTDGGQTWTETFRNQEEAAFYNCIDFAPGGNVGLGVSDPVDGKFRIIRTTDGGASWEVLPSEGMPDSTGQANFSASGDCLTMTGRDAWFGAGGDDARVFHSVDRGETWTVEDAELPSGEAGGCPYGFRQAAVAGRGW